MNIKKVLGLCTIVLCTVFSPLDLLACSAKGPADPVTGLISYPPGTGHSEGQSSVPADGLEGTPFQGGKYYKGWVGAGTEQAVKLLVVPAGTKLAFEGVIESTTTTNTPPHWEEGKMKGVGGTTVDAAPLPTWTISGNGRGDYRDGTFPPEAVGLKYVNFEAPPSVIIAPDTPNEKAIWKLTYDRETAVRVLVSVWNDPIARATFMESGTVPADFDMDEIAAAAKEPQGDDGAKSLSDYELSATGASGVQGLKDGLDSTLTQRSGTIMQTGGVVTRTFKNADDEDFTVDMAEEARVIVKAGYIAMQGAADMDFYPTGRYNTKYFITPPSSQQYEVGKARLALSFSTPTAPDYWIVDLHSGLESARDCVWCWIEVEAELKPEGTKITDQSDVKNFYDIRERSYAVGGVFVRGLYQSGNSSAGRNTMVYVVVADTQPPAHYHWVNSAASGETGKALESTIKFRVYDNNPVIGAEGSHNNIFSVFGELADFEYVEAGKRPQNLEDNPDVFTRYLEPVKDGFNEKNLRPTLHYNVCVPAYAGFKVAGDAKNYAGPLPLVDDRLVLPLQKFVWKSVAPDKITVSDFMIHNESGGDVSNLDSLSNEPNWKGYSSYLVTVAADGMDEPMGFGLADNSAAYTLSISDDLKATAPISNKLSEGIPVDGSKVQFFGWSKALKMFVSASDGVLVRNSYPDGDVNYAWSNRSPGFTGDESVGKVLGNKFSGAEIAFAAATTDFLCTVKEPANVDRFALKLEVDKVIKGGSLGGCTLPANSPDTDAGAISSPDGAWGRFAYVASLADKGRPNIALEVLNSKNEKAAVFGNLYAMGESDNLAKAIDGAGTDNWVHTVDSNTGDKTYSPASSYYEGTAWEFKDDIENDLYMAMKNSMDAGTFKPWLFAFPSSDQAKLWKTGYWNGDDSFNNKRMAFQQGSRDRLVFRYWVYDNINPFNLAGGVPNGVKTYTSGRERFKSVSGFVTALVRLTDVPGYKGEVALDKVWWPDYIFHNPSGGSSEECSISLYAEDEKTNARTLKLWFRIIPPSRELIRTIEDRRNRD